MERCQKINFVVQTDPEEYPINLNEWYQIKVGFIRNEKTNDLHYIVEGNSECKF